MAYSQLTCSDRIRIGVYKQQGKSATEIALSLDRHRSTIYRELGRNSSGKGYESENANDLSMKRKAQAASEPRINNEKKDWVFSKLKLQWSPEQIAQRMKLELGSGVSHEWIYGQIYDDREAGGELYLNLRWGRKTRKKRGGGRDRRGQIPNRVSIEKRPAIANRRDRLGDWEGDTVIGANHRGKLVTLVDRKSRYTMIQKIKDKTATVTSAAVIKAINKIGTTFKTITFDNGKEFANHEEITARTGARIYFAHPYSSYERGTNENTNGLIRQYLPKKMDLSEVLNSTVKKVENLLNNRPRKTLGFKSPYEVHFAKEVKYFSKP